MTFKSFYEQGLMPVLLRLERKRKWLITLFVLSVALIILGIWLLTQAHLPLLTMLAWLPIMLYGSFLAYQMANFKSVFKPAVVQSILGFIGQPISYDLKKYINKQQFADGRLFVSSAEYYHGEDYFKGLIGKTFFEVCELEVKKLSKVRSKMDPVFRGVYFVAQIQQYVPCRMLVLPQENRQYLTRSIKTFIREGGMELTPDTTSGYLLFSDSGQIFEHQKMKDLWELILDYSNRINKRIYVSTLGNQFYLAIDEPKDILEPSIFRNNVDFASIEVFYKDIYQIIKLVTSLDDLYSKK